MKIRVVSRDFFARIKGTPFELELLINTKIISINSSDGSDSEPPFSEWLRSHRHLLTLNFDDIADEPETKSSGKLVAFSPEMAKAIVKFVGDGELPLLIHCAAGISRSGAVGEVLNWYFNRILTDNAADYVYFERNNRQIIPNALVRKILLQTLDSSGATLAK